MTRNQPAPSLRAILPRLAVAVGCGIGGALAATAAQAQSNCRFLECTDDPPGAASPAAPAGPKAAPQPAPASGQQRGTYWNHNGSLMYLQAEASGARRFVYFQVSDRMSQAGARPGDVVFEGRRDGDGYAGTAYIFNKACGRFGYRVSGQVSNGDTMVVMTGTAPRIDAACQSTGGVGDRLVFEYRYKIQ